ncbi:hypothetical protein [Kitasatospora sp. MAP5-34]|uniref:hypothetical protein n=1 Tax=Kitasatospora sp. MAP5-34 TaxID=3035102 RepID=UPI002472EBE7|nr:hypothetical protein [Kitasatospora sp. MAP5-34]MDH6580664.1 hypothetical protein [Kitasatospora sp. MAP5-34]
MPASKNTATKAAGNSRLTETLTKLNMSGQRPVHRMQFPDAGTHLRQSHWLYRPGFGLLLRQDILDGYRKAARQG